VELDRVPVGIFDEDLSTARPALHLVAEVGADLVQRGDRRVEIL
jgi:hypothetical protein